MAERYQRCFTLPVNLYAPGAPVLIAAGALLLDTQTNGVLAQLKLQNLGAKPIKSVKVAVSPLDPAGRALGEPVAYQYLDLSVARDEMFGQKVPIRLPDVSARSFTAAVTEVIFSDNTIWSADAAAAWAPLADPKPLSVALGDAELFKQYQLRYGTDAIVQPVRIGDLWRCACGALSLAEEAACHVCGKDKAALLDTDLSALEREKNERLEAERKAREAKEAADREAAEKRKAAAAAAAKKTAKILKIVLPVLVAVIAAALVVTKLVIPNVRYSKAVKLMEAGKYDEAISAFEAMDGYKDSDEKIAEAEIGKAVAKAEALEKEGKIAEAAMAYGTLIDVAPECRERSFALWDKIAQRSTLASGLYLTVGIHEDGTVSAIGNNEKHQCEVSDWKNIIAVDAGAGFTLGLRADGTVVAVGLKDDGRCDVSEWTDIVAICAGAWHSVGLRADGTVVATGANDDSQCEVADWTNIVAIAADEYHTVGLRADGTVVATGDANKGVADWTDIIAVAAGTHHNVGLRADGTVIAVGGNAFKQRDVSSWKNIVAISAKNVLTIGLCANGSVITTGELPDALEAISEWKDIVAISVGFDHVVGLKSDGSVVAAGVNDDGQCDVDGWTDIKLPSDK